MNIPHDLYVSYIFGLSKPNHYYSFKKYNTLFKNTFLNGSKIPKCFFIVLKRKKNKEGYGEKIGDGKKKKIKVCLITKPPK